MQCDIDEATRRRAKSPHEFFLFNLAVFHLLATPAGIALGIGLWGFLIPLLLSTAVMLFTLLRARQCRITCPWFVTIHWQLALRRYRLLLIAYGITATILALGWLLTMGMEQPSTQHIMRTVFTRLSVVPTLLMVMVLFVMESGAIVQTTNGQVPKPMAARLPPPPGLCSQESGSDSDS
ncbi:MAG TPA: hypothetical protein VGE00_04930 [Gammaproteobacteria bacterium]